MRAFHSNWTKPFLVRHTGSYFIEDFELLTTILSALKWQSIGGDIQMITDSIGATYYKNLGIEKIWNLGIDDSLEQNMDKKLNPNTFWAAGKIYALEKQSGSCVMLDTDFIVWENLEEVLCQHDLAVIHREALQEEVYPPKEKLKMLKSYHYPEKWDWSLQACNTAFAFFKEDALRTHYVKESIRFMKGVEGEDPLIYMVFAEQRLLAMCAAEKGIDIFALSNIDELFHSKQTLFTHVWGYKKQIRSNKKAREQFCRRCIKRIKKDFPSYYPLLERIDCLQVYL